MAAASADKTVRIWNSKTGAPRRVLRLPAAINQVRFSPDGQLLLIASGNTVQLVQSATGRIYKLLVHPQVVKTADFSPTQLQVATGCADGKVRLWQMQKQLPAVLDRHQSAEHQANRSQPAVSQVRFSPDGQTLVATDADSQIWLWDAATGDLRVNLAQVPGMDISASRPPAIAFSPDSRRLITNHRSLSRPALTQEIQLWDVQTGERVDGFRAHSNAVESILFSPDGSLIATAGIEGEVQLWAAEVGSEFPTVKLKGEAARSIVFRSSRPPASPVPTETTASSPGSAQSLQPMVNRTGAIAAIGRSLPLSVDEIVAVTRDGVIQRLPLLPAGDVAGEMAQSALLTSKALKRKANWFGQVGETLEAWKLNFFWQKSKASPVASQPELSPISSTATAIKSTNTPDGRSALRSGVLLRLAEKLSPDVALTDVTLSADSQLVAAADDAGNVELWQLNSDFSVQRVRRLSASIATDSPPPQSSQAQPESAPRAIRNLAFSADGQKLLGIGNDRIVRVWEVASGKLISRLEGHEASVEQAQFSPDGQLIATVSRDRTIRIWQVTSGQVLAVLHQQSTITGVRFSPNGQLIVTTGQDGIARVLEATTGTLRVVLAGHRGTIWDAQFSPDGQMLVTASEDGTARLWDAQTGIERTTLRPAEAEAAEPLQQAFFSPDGRYIATLTKSGRFHLWAATWEGLLALARDRSLRQLQPEECLRYLGLTPNACPVLPN